MVNRLASRLEKLEAKNPEASPIRPLSRADVLERLNQAARRAETMDGPAAVQAERAALMDIAKLEGWVIDRQERGKPGDYGDLTDDELAERIEREAADLLVPSGRAASRSRPN